MTEPTTEAGRSMVTKFWTTPGDPPLFISDYKPAYHIAAIEAEARADCRDNEDALRQNTLDLVEDAAAQTAAAVEALRDGPHADPCPWAGSNGALTDAEWRRCRCYKRVLNDFSAAAEAHDKAVAERAVREARGDLHSAKRLLLAIDGDMPDGLRNQHVNSALDFIDRALTTEEAAEKENDHAS